MKDTKQILLLLNGTEKYDNDLLDGIVRYADRKPEWRLRVRGWSEDWAGFNSPQRPDGVIARSHTTAEMQALKRSGVPVVNVSSTLVAGVPQVCRDNYKIGIMAAEHLLADCGLRNFAFVFHVDDAANHRRGDGFRDRLQQSGVESKAFGPSKTFSVRRAVAVLASKIRSLPTPVGVFAAEPFSGRHVLEACVRLGRPVPQDVAIVGGVDEDLVCLACHPQLTSIRLGSERVGHEAAALLGRLLDGEPAPKEPILVAPLRLAVRESTETWSGASPVLAEAIHFVRANACRGLTTKELLEHIPKSRRWVEQAFRETIGRSPSEEARRCQLMRAKELLETSNLTMKEIAAACGYRSAVRFSASFQRWVGVSPTEYRNQSGTIRFLGRE